MPGMPPQVLLTLLPGCSRLQEVVVRFMGRRYEGAEVEIRCPCFNRGCIVPMEVPDEVYADNVVVSSCICRLLSRVCRITQSCTHAMRTSPSRLLVGSRCHAVYPLTYTLAVFRSHSISIGPWCCGVVFTTTNYSVH